MKRIFISGIFSAFFLLSCYQNSKGKSSVSINQINLNNTEISTQNVVSNITSEDWINKIFACEIGTNFCFPNENKVCTKRFMKFVLDAFEIYGPSNLTEEELPIAEEEYKKKWSKIYPLYTTEMAPFGRGNGDVDKLENVNITKVNDLEYLVVINYGYGIKTENQVKLVPDGNSFLIDYIETKFIE